MKEAKIQAPIVVNEAIARRESQLAKNQATVNAHVAVTEQKTKSYKKIQDIIGSQSKFLEFYRAQTINNYNPDNLLLGVKAKIDP